MEQAVWVRWGRAADGFPASVGPAWPFLRSCCAHMHGVGMHAGKNAFSLCCCGLCVFKVCARGSLNSCAHVGMRGSCRRARANRTSAPPSEHLSLLTHHQLAQGCRSLCDQRPAHAQTPRRTRAKHMNTHEHQTLLGKSLPSFRKSAVSKWRSRHGTQYCTLTPFSRYVWPGTRITLPSSSMYFDFSPLMKRL